MIKNKKILALLISMGLLINICPAANAADMEKKTESGKEIKITSDGQLEMRYGTGEAIFTKNVEVSDDLGPMLTCEKLTVFFVDQNTINKLKAEENVFLFHDDMIGHCAQVVYTVATEQAIMTGDPVIRKGQDTYAADIIRINRADGRVLFEPSARLVVFPKGKDPLKRSPRKNKKPQKPDTEDIAQDEETEEE